MGQSQVKEKMWIKATILIVI